MEFSLASDAFAPREARSIVRARTKGVDESAGAILELLAAELVTNAVVHGKGPIGLRIDQRAGCVRIAVSDASNDEPILQAPTPERGSGRGIFLIDALASAWGVERGAGDGKSVWFELDSTRSRPADQQR